MCGIAGFFDYKHTSNLQIREKSVSKICDAQHHRGPDAVGIWSDQVCTLGHTRLSIIDIDKRSNQPMLDKSERFALSFNGEIYNFKTLKQELISLGDIFTTESDTEVLIQGFYRWGLSVFSRLDGMFACAIYDTLEKKLFLARDRIGEKPLYYSNKPDSVLFSSELKALVQLPNIATEISTDALFQFFALRYVSDPDTIFSNIQSVKPGTILQVNSEGEQLEKSFFSYELENSNIRHQYNIEEYVDSLEEKLIESIQTRLVADVPVGAFLSSGIDSSLVCAIAAKKLGSQVKCFSAGFVGGTDNETAMAQKIAQNLGLPFEQYLVSSDDILTAAASFGHLLDEPNGDRSCVPTFFLSKLIKSQVTVAVSGDGGDELFGGYGRYLPFTHQKNGNDREAEGETQRVCQYFEERLPVFPLNQLSQIMPEQFRNFKNRFVSRFSSVFVRQDLQDIERMRLIDAHSYLPGAVLAKVDRMSMQHSLEVRTPFLSPDILSLSQKLPMSLCANDRVFKVALRIILSRYLPDSLIKHQKQGFGMPASFFSNYAKIFNELAIKADLVLAEWQPFRHSPEQFSQLRSLARSNINSCWAWIVLGQWVESID